MGRSIAYISSGSKNRVDLELYIKLQEQVWDVLKKNSMQILTLNTIRMSVKLDICQFNKSLLLRVSEGNLDHRLGPHGFSPNLLP